MFRSILVLFTFLFQLTTVGQETVKHLATSLSDSGKNAYENAELMYSWITENIAYDAKSFSKGKYLTQSPSETIKKGKALCYEYAELLTSMCTEIGLEAYTIAGYSKGGLYQEDQTFLRAQHTWVVIRTDSVWVHADPTYGSGFLFKKPGPIGVLLIKVLRSNYQASKMKFIRSTDSNYFDMNFELLTQTHYPLNPAWMQDPLLPSYYSFAYSSDSSMVSLPNFKSEIEACRFKAEEYRFFEDGVIGNKYNKYNEFDRALGIVNKSVGFDLQRNISEENLFQFEKFRNENSEAFANLTHFKSNLDSLYRSHVRLIRNMDKREQKLYDRVKAKYKSNKKNYSKNIVRTIRKEASIGKKISREYNKKSRSQTNYLPKKIEEDTMSVHNFEKTKSFYLQMIDSEFEMSSAKIELDSLIGGTKKLVNQQALLNDSLVFKNTNFLEQCSLLSVLCYFDIEKDILQFLGMQENSFEDVRTAYSNFSGIKKRIAEENKKVYAKARSIENILKNERDIIREVYFYSPGNDTIMALYEQNKKIAAEHFDRMVLYNNYLLEHTDLQEDFYDVNLFSMRDIRKEMRRQSKVWNRYYKKKLNQLEVFYNSEKGIYTTLSDQARNNSRTAGSLLNQYYRELEKLSQSN